MHRAQRLTWFRLRRARLIRAAFVAVIAAAALTAARPVGWMPLCAAFDEGSVEWYLFFCYVDPPPKDPRA